MKTGENGGRISHVRVYALGRFAIEIDGAPLQFETRAQRKPLELLKVLIAQGGEQVSEDTLNEALWPDADGDQAHGTFTSTLHRLRRLIGPETLLLQDRRLTLNPGNSWVDVDAFHSQLELASQSAQGADGEQTWRHLEQALELYRGPFLEGEFDPPEILTARERIHSIFLRNIRTLSAHFKDQGDSRRAVELYQRGLEVDPLAEEFYAALMRIHLELGQSAEGIVVYRRCRDMLQAGAGIEPSPETEAIHHELLTARPESTASILPDADLPPRLPAVTPSWRPRRKLLATGLAILMLAGGAVLTWGYFQARNEAAAVAAFEREAAFPLPDRPSIAVLAFDNMSGDPEQEYFSDGLSEDIITKLASLSSLFVIARNSSFQYKGKQVDVRQIGRDLGVRYVLEGSVKKSANRVRVTAQLIDAATGGHLFAKQYERELKDIFAVQDDIANQVLAELHIKLVSGEWFSYIRRNTNNYEAFDAHMRAGKLYWSFEKEANFKAEKLALKAIELDPNFPNPMSLLGWIYFEQARLSWVPDPKKAFHLAEFWARKSLEVNPNHASGLIVTARFLSVKGKHKEAIAMGERAVELQPSNAGIMSSVALSYLLDDRPQEALEMINRALRLAPYPPGYFNWVAAMAHDWLGSHEESVAEFEKMISKQKGGPGRAAGWVGVIAGYSNQGKQDQARSALDNLIKEYPEYTVSKYVKGRKALPYKNFDWLEKHVDILRKMGLPEGIAQSRSEAAAVAAFEREAAFPLSDRPSIAVLAFDNLSGDPEQEYFSDGLSEDIITKLASLSSLFVIARNSSFQYKGKQVDVRRIGRELGVRYVLEGSVKKSGGRVRVTAQLIDAATGEHLFAKTYDRELKELFAVQDDIATQVLTDLNIKIGTGAEASIILRSTDNFEAFDTLMRAVKFYRSFEKGANFQAEALSKKALDLDPNFAAAMVLLGWVYMEQARRPWVPDPKKAYDLSERWGNRALEADPDNAAALALLSRFHSLKGNHEQAIAKGKRAMELQPSDAANIGILAYTYMLARQSKAALEAINKALRLAPFAPAWFHVVAGEANQWNGRHKEAVDEYTKGMAKLKGGPMRDVAMVGLIVNYSLLGESDRAAAVARDLIQSSPEFTVSEYVRRVKRWPYKDFAWLEKDMAILRQVGLPEGSTSSSLPPSDVPSIAVLAFDNMSGDPEQEYFSDGLSESIITRLAKVSDLLVIARNSSFRYKGQSIDIRRVGRELGVRYLQEGSVQRTFERIRLSAQLIDATSGVHLWAESYDRELADLFKVMDELTLAIVTELEVKLTVGERQRLIVHETENIQALDRYLLGAQQFLKFEREPNARARVLFQEAVQLDPAFGNAVGWLAWTHFADYLYRWSKDPQASMRRAEELAHQALSADPEVASAYTVLSRIHAARNEFDQAITSAERAVELWPGASNAVALLSHLLVWAGRFEEGLVLSRKAIRLAPYPNAFLLYFAGDAFYFTGHYEDAIAWYRKYLERQKRGNMARLSWQTLISAQVELGRIEEARVEVDSLLKEHPSFSVAVAEREMRMLPIKDFSFLDRHLANLRKAGLSY